MISNNENPIKPRKKKIRGPQRYALFFIESMCNYSGFEPRNPKQKYSWCVFGWRTASRAAWWHFLQSRYILQGEAHLFVVCRTARTGSLHPPMNPKNVNQGKLASTLRSRASRGFILYHTVSHNLLNGLNLGALPCIKSCRVSLWQVIVQLFLVIPTCLFWQMLVLSWVKSILYNPSPYNLTHDNWIVHPMDFVDPELFTYHILSSIDISTHDSISPVSRIQLT